MRNNKKVTSRLGVGKDQNEQPFIAVTTIGNYQKEQIYRVLMSGVNTALSQYRKELKTQGGKVKFLLPSQQIVFNQQEVERSLYRLQNNWLVKFRTQLLGIQLNLSYEDQDDFEATLTDKKRTVLVPKQMELEQV